MTRHGALRSTSLARTVLPFAVASVVAMALTGCGAVGVPGSAPSGSTAPGPSPNGLGMPTTIPASGEVQAQTVVLQHADGPTLLCLGPIGESYPPHCGGPVDMLNWDWNEVEQSTTASSVTWGDYMVQGTWDGTSFTRTQEPIPLSLYDPVANFDPRLDPATPGPTDDATLVEIERAIYESGEQVHYLSIDNGYVIVGVSYDDGTLQTLYDQEFGPDTVIVQSALRPVS